MKFVRFAVQDSRHTGVLEQETIKHITGNILPNGAIQVNNLHLSEVKLLAPLKPNQVIGIGANYVSELEDYLLNYLRFQCFLKPVSSVIGPEDEIIIPKGIDSVKFESELAVIIGKEAKMFLKKMF